MFLIPVGVVLLAAILLLVVGQPAADRADGVEPE